MKNYFLPLLCPALAILALTRPACAENLDDFTWPQEFETTAFEIAIYEPQIHEWKDMRHVTARAAVGMKPKGGDEVTFGAITIEADTTADMDERVVYFGDRAFTEIRFPDAKSADEAENRAGIVRSILNPTRPLTMSLDSMIANVDRTALQAREVDANLAPPPIFYSAEPALLVIFLGDPKFEMIEESSGLLFAVNTNWDLILHAASATYYLLAGDSWLQTTDVTKGAWTAAASLPSDFQALPDDENWSEVKATLNAPPAGAVPKIFVSNQPAELILTDGSPQLSPISGTTLMKIGNTEADVFYLATEKNYYFLTSGRWFRSAAVEGPWASATEDLPAEFVKLPEDEQFENVLTSVPGTAAAEEAVITASIPTTATVNRSEAQLEVKYDDAPDFIDIPGTAIKFAANTEQDVFLVSGKYYCCEQGIWFEAPAATGAWSVCDKVPDEIYTIPSQHPKYNVTYVYVYNSTPTTVQVGYTAGYTGAVIARGLLLFGLGYWIGSNDDHWHYWWRYPPRPCFYGYGCGAHYSWYRGGYYRAGYRYYGPYGGAGGGAIYNPWTGGYARGGYRYGPRGAVGGMAAYNPWTNTAVARVGARTPYGSWGRSAVVRDDEWMRTAHASNWRGSVGGVQTSGGAGAVRVDRRHGSEGFVAKTGDGDAYVGRDGNIYKRDQDGNWSKRSDGDWNTIDRPDTRPPNWSGAGNTGGNTPRVGGATTLPATPAARPSTQVTRPATPAARPATPAARPTAPVARPATPAARPATPAARPSTQVTRPTYTPSTNTSRQLGIDSRSRDRSSFQQSRSSSFERGGGGGLSGRGGGGGLSGRRR